MLCKGEGEKKKKRKEVKAKRRPMQDFVRKTNMFGPNGILQVRMKVFFLLGSNMLLLLLLRDRNQLRDGK